MTVCNNISAATRPAMNARVLLITYIAVSNCVTIHQNNEPDIVSYIREELPPLFILCNLTDIVTITAPEKHSNDSLYYLYNPNNDVTRLDIQQNGAAVATTDDTVVANKYYVRNVNIGKKVDSKTNDSFGGDNEFVIGPVGEEDHGNWVLSVYYERNGSWVEEFQVITIHIVDYVPIQPTSPVLTEGDTLELGFAYPLPDVETCELVQPSDNRSYDRYFREYERKSLDNCTYILRNVSTRDSGLWTIIAVGNIVYEGRSTVEVKEIQNVLEAGRMEAKKNANLLEVGRIGVTEVLPLASSSDGTKYLKYNVILPIGLILKIYCF